MEPEPFDAGETCYATLYEEWLLRYETMRDEERRASDDSCCALELESSALAIRAGRLGAIQRAMLDDSDPALTALWDHTLCEMDRDATSHLWHSKTTNRNVPIQVPIDVGANVDVNSFFDNFPECARSEWDDDSESDMSEEEDIFPPPARIGPHTANPPNHRSLGADDTSRDTPPLNPYRHSHQNITTSHLPMPPQPLNAAYCKTNAPFQQSHQSSNDNASWEDLRLQQNPFQTAREVARAEMGDDNDPSDLQRRPSYDQPHNSFVKPPVALQPNRGPNIPDSLKRKFQPPRRNPNEPQRQVDSGGMRKIGGLVSNGGASVARTGPSKSDKDDEELPEALKGLDKELIEKIQNEIMESGDSITFDDIAGLADAKQTVQELVCWPMKRPDLFTGLRRGPNGLLLFGPPGTGKTLIGKAIAHESGATFFSISSSSLTSKWIGEGEKLVRTLFAVAAYREPAVVFIDEIDSLLTRRKADDNEASRRIKTEFLVQLDGTGTSRQGRVLVIGATNRPHELDDAARRRFVKRLYVPLPAREDREALLRTLLHKNRHSLTDKDLTKLSIETKGFSGADLKALCTDAAMGPIRQLGPKALEVDPNDVPPISYKYFRQALRATMPSVAPADLEIYVEWNNLYGSKSIAAFDDDDESDQEPVS